MFSKQKPQGTIHERVAKAAGEIKEAIRSSKDIDGGLQSLVAQIKFILRRDHLTYKQRVLPLHCGVHPSNKSGDGLSPMDVQNLLEFIAMTHWNWDEVACAIAIEIAPHGARAEQYKKYNYELAKRSNGLLADVEMDELKVVTATCGHTTGTLRCIAGGAKAINETWAEGGVFSMAKVAAKSPGMAEAANIGIEYEVLAWQMDEACPEIAEIIIEADNLKHRAARQDARVLLLT